MLPLEHSSSFSLFRNYVLRSQAFKSVLPRIVDLTGELRNYWNMKGRISWKLRELHDQYGPVVRIAPDELSYTTSGAWRKIYTQRHPEFSKCLDGRGIAPATVNGKYAMPTENQERHGRLRRAVNPAFSERALRDQEDFLRRHSNHLIFQLKSRCEEGPVDMTWWYNLCAFDIVSGGLQRPPSSPLQSVKMSRL